MNSYRHRPLQDRPYDEIVKLELSLADLESRSLKEATTRNAPQIAWEMWKTVCGAHDQLLDELDRRELHYEDG
jgi:hypothetical protein